jgi:hypothetical protein
VADEHKSPFSVISLLVLSMHISPYFLKDLVRLRKIGVHLIFFYLLMCITYAVIYQHFYRNKSKKVPLFRCVDHKE